jgi:hypothetical protein
MAQEAGFFGAASNFISENASSGFEKIKYANSAIGGVTKDWLDIENTDLKASSPGLQNSPNNIRESFASTESFNSSPAVEASYETFESVDVGGRGMIGGIDDLQDKLREKFGNNIPEQYQEFMAKKPEEVAREWGVYRPGEENESAKVFKGAKFEIGKNGEVIFTDHEGSSQKVFEPTAGTAKNFNGEFFDAGNRPAVSPESSFADTDYESGVDARPASPEVNEGYVTTRTIKPETTSWYEKPVPTEYGTSPVRGSWKFVEDANGNIVKVDTSRTISDDVIKFRQNPRNFMTADLSQTNLLAKTDSFAVKTLTDNRELVEKFLVEKNLLDAPPAGVTDKQLSFLKDSVAQTNKELQIKTGGAFDGKLKEEPSIFGRVEKTPNSNPTRVVSFDTDAPIKPRVSPSVTSVSEGSDFVPSKTPVLEKVEVEVDKNKVFEPELSRVSTGTLEKISSTNEEITYSFKTENVKGPIRFTLNKDGVIDGIQTTASTLIKGQENPTSILKDGWESSASKYSSDTSTGIKKIRLGAGVITKYQEILRSGGFNSNSPEYKYLNGEIEFLKNKFKDVLK